MVNFTKNRSSWSRRGV